jgi:hypothetical protein
MQCFISISFISEKEKPLNMEYAGVYKIKKFVKYVLNSSTTFHFLLNLFFSLPGHDGSRDSTIGIATSYGLNSRGLGVRVPVEGRFCSSSRRPGRFWGPPSVLSNGYRGFFPPGVKRQGREANHSHTTSAKAKNMWIYTSTPL